MSRLNRVKFAGAGVVAALALFAGGAVIAAEVPSEQQILQALKPKPLTRGLTQSPSDVARKQDEEKFVDGLRTRRTRGLSVGDREKVAEIAKEKPQIDLEINFDYNSAEINARSLPGVNNLGKALTQMPGSVFVLAGHTDAKGGDGYNQSLSERRADAVRKYLVKNYGLTADNLVTVGYGKSHIKNSTDPYADENRRVQVVNMKSN
jgi:outer membrane protein OmpA-like peptidoglycan-associated protein